MERAIGCATVQKRNRFEFENLEDRMDKGSSIYGGVAHLGERLTGSQEVRGSIPLISTTICPKTLILSGFSAF